MIFRKLTAVFGRLDGETLSLHEGLNIVARPNESGKSTWCAFLLSMLYGIDTAERASRGNLPVKTRCRPWNGREMSGRVELNWQGREITIERGAQGRVPLGAVRVYETESGTPVDLPGECGRALLGVERSVYQRSGFIGQRALKLEPDGALESRLRALVTTDGEGVSASEALSHLRDLRNRRRHNKTGLLPQAEAALAEVDAALAGQEGLGRELLSLAARRDELEGECAALRRRLAAQRAKEAGERRMRLEQARLDWEKHERIVREKEESVANLPPEEKLEELAREIDHLTGAAQSLKAELDALGEAPAEPARPAVFAGLDADAVRNRAEADAARASSLRPGGRVKLLFLAFLTLCALAGGVVGAALPSIPIAAAGFALGVLGLILTLLLLRRNARAKRERKALLERYGAADEAAIRKAGADCREALLLYEHQSESYRTRRDALSARRETLSQSGAALLARGGALRPGATGLGELREGVQRAIHLQKFYQAALREAQPARARYEALRDASAGDTPEGDVPLPEEDASGDPKETAERLQHAEAELGALRSKLDQARGRAETLGDPAALAARREQLTADIERCRREYDALTLAMDALGAADAELQSRFSPRINRTAGAYMARMSAGRYDHVLLEQTMAVTARESGEPAGHPLAALSAGTADQLYLAVRLAISQALLPPDAPLVLDDALASFDDNRMAAAMELLADLARERQIILLTCHSREAAWARERGLL